MATPTAPLGTPSNVTQTIGPGQLWMADYGTGAFEAGITSASAALPSGARNIGYTDDGTEMAYTYSTDNVVVAEEVEPLATPVTAVAGSVSFTFAEATAANLLAVLNNGSVFVGGYVAPAIPGQEKTVTIVQECPSGARWVFRKCLQGGGNPLAQWKKAPDKHQIAAQFNLQKVDANPSFRVYPNAASQV
jgi:uncharacterized Fe-S cluster protein YjdI